MGRPAIAAKTFPGKRVDDILACTMATTVMVDFECTARTAVKLFSIVMDSTKLPGLEARHARVHRIAPCSKLGNETD